MTTNKMRELQAAVEHVERALDDLKVKSSVCGECGMRHYADFAEWQTHKVLSGIAQKLNNILQSQDNEENDNGTQSKSSGRV